MSDEIKEISLERCDGGSFIDEEGCSWFTIESWFFSGIMNGCGCGYSDILGRQSLRLFLMIGIKEPNGYSLIFNHKKYELMAHWFNSLELIEHGSSINAPWLSEKGLKIYEIICKLHQED